MVPAAFQISEKRFDWHSRGNAHAHATHREALFAPEWGLRSEVIANDLKKAEVGYRADIARLMKAPQNIDQIKSELALAETQWVFLGQAIERLDANKTSATELEHVSKACDNIL